MNPNPNNAPSPIEKVAAYNRLRRRLSMLEFGALAAFLAASLATGLTFNLSDLAGRFSGGPVVRLLVYFLIGGLVYEILTLPLSTASGYTIEKRFGLSSQSFRAWAWDHFKSRLLGFGLGLIAVQTLYLFFRLLPDLWWLPAGGVFTLFFIFLAQAAPVLIMPLFFKFRILADEALSARLETICRKAGVLVMGIYEWGLSAKTSRANAALLGIGPTRRVVLSDSLIAAFTPSEIEVVLAHELGHHRLHHLPQLLALQTALTFAAFYLADTAFRAFGPLAGLERLADPAGLPLLLLTFMFVGLIVTPLVNTVSRALERQADRFALQLTGLSGSFISAMERLAALNLVELAPHPVIEFLFHGHPAPFRRIEAAKAFRREQQEAGDAVH